MEEEKQFIIAIRVRNGFGILTRISGMFTRRAFSIDSLTASDTEVPGIARITIAMTGTVGVRNQIIKQLSKLSDVMEVKEMAENSVTRELMLIKVTSTPDTRRDVMDAVTVYRASIVDYSPSALTVCISGDKAKLDAFIQLMQSYGILELCRTGCISVQRDNVTLAETDMSYITDL